MSAVSQRTSAIKILWAVVEEQQSLRTVLPHYLKAHSDNVEQRFIRQLCYGSLRFFYQLDALVDKLLNKDFKKDDRILRYVLIIGLYQLIHLRTADHAAVTETVNTVKPLKKQWASGVINACLRNFLRQRDSLLNSLLENAEAHYAHPQWFIDTVKKAWPDHWENILTVNNQQPPLFLRTNIQKISREHLITKLQQAKITAQIWPHNDIAIYIPEAGDITQFPGFSEGEFSVQDPAAQYAASLLDLQPCLNILDACAAPGGKTCHMLETEKSLSVVALDQDAKRLEKVQENLTRLQLTADICCDSVENFAKNYHGTGFDRILLDAPCSATGVIRRHPDIKVLRHAEDINDLAKTQLSMLQALWPLLKPQGRLVYATCSVLPEENHEVIAAFIAQQKDVNVIPVALPLSIAAPVGQQFFPTEHHQDGFYYAVLTKSK